jgi:uncharacterized membrane protein
MNETNKGICALAYIIFFIPMLVDSNNEEYKFHTNQGLNLFLLFLAISIIGSFIPVIGWFIILPLGGIMALVLCVMGIINAVNEKQKELPIIGKYRLIK